ncbi:MAG: flagellar motor switch protein FliM [Candidatus Aquicultor secundus]|uniref:Flagellar motor switch protein FliM n=1 Tax=Candidatus Aquicultor secundus TaxID=1973895 RepID=A0A2M7T8A6_9ACTN|nr:flagellar motor switch protein FliM [Candidatus Aquicultor secundus]NCO66024.1 flagellar motor switch protein FliM [Solirubrobacter sp.]OIO85631.1 MAG: flagellar motor switch protein FliM [Candidatus Aquicultor secundus]PIU27147.1 MAG: flagellar motor switch protein FliM [Candidatus Aquicultor secundus]PIW21950.1 MAG: flagellar motor switch protein FliM [Candidatus Aquicultor secundus]PIX51941.1 MAG: flagellar motor switch protein FliM [Candidatus Aquicultor secundus]
MAGTLTQEEINALLSSSASGMEPLEEEPLGSSTDSKHVRLYNFRHPDKFSKSHLSTMELIYEGFSRHLKTALFVYVRQSINFSLASVEQQSFEEYVESLPTPSSLITFKMKDLPGSAVLEISPELTFLILDRLLGGMGDQPTKVRDLTEIETVIIRKVSERILMAFRMAWSEIHDVEPSIKSLETNPQLLQVVPPNEIVATATLEVRIGEATGAMSVCLPYLTLESVMPKLSRQVWFSAKFENKDGEKAENSRIRGNISKVKLPVSIELGRTKISINDLLQLKPGDSIQLDTPANHDVRVLVNGRIKFYAQPGVIGKRLAVKTTRVAD